MAISRSALPPMRCRNSTASCRRKSRRRRSERSSSGATTSMRSISRAACVTNGAALFIDYGHIESDVGETLQSVNEHAFADPLSAPGAGRHHRACRLFHLWSGRREHGDGGSGSGHAGAVPARAWNRRAGRRAATRRKHRTGCQYHRRGRAADRSRAHRHGRIVQGDGVSRSETRSATGVCSRHEMPRFVACPRWTVFATHSSRAKAACPDGIYASLNSGVGSNDDPGHVAENRARMAQRTRCRCRRA